MTQHYSEPHVPNAPEGSAPPEVIVLGDAAVLTRGSDSQSVENKQEPYD
ncbi:albusnodin family lasso peptide [Streptomyces corynorhini]|uniref:Albusnodin family lasso peptide n=1 Tax=Streptomyces corynorhini TaxID=2282652 RepID=A0A370B4Y4_9ACTN|nr:albusnodin family lasso peptide [Streptomyces corynorhini]RDG36878.1 albusnodin family lasso peptide [Streptomyces corynorhini]